MLLSKIRLFLSVAVFLVLLQPSLASANGGPLYYPANGYGLLQLDEQSNISLVHEKVSYTIKENPSKHQNGSEVSVQYELHNKNDFQKTVDVLFLTSSISNISVMEGEKRIETFLAPEARPVNWYTEVKETVNDPISGKALPLSRYENNEVEGTRFALSFEPNETKNIVIQYIDAGGMYDKGVINKIFSHSYYLTPAKFWEGEPQVELEVKLYKSGSSLHSSIPMEKADATTYKVSLNKLPAEEWYFSYTFPKRMLFPTNIEKDHNLLVLASTAALTLLAAGLALALKNRLIFNYSSIAIFGFAVYFISKMGGYPFNAIFVGFTDVMIGAALIVCNVMIAKRIRKQRKNNISPTI